MSKLLVVFGLVAIGCSSSTNSPDASVVVDSGVIDGGSDMTVCAMLQPPTMLYEGPCNSDGSGGICFLEQRYTGFF